MPLNVYRISCPSQDQAVDVVARTHESAWLKFITQRFGPLKPNKAEYVVSLIGPLPAECRHPTSATNAQ